MKLLFTPYMAAFLVLTLLIIARPAFAEEGGSPLAGLWLTQNERSVIEIKPCDEELCGSVYWITEGGMQMDSKNPDENLRKRPMCGLKILWGFKKDSETRWEDGKIYKADDGDTYDSYLELQDNGDLKVRGYMGLAFLGKSQFWHRVTKKQYPTCGKGA